MTRFVDVDPHPGDPTARDIGLRGEGHRDRYSPERPMVETKIHMSPARRRGSKNQLNPSVLAKNLVFFHSILKISICRTL